MNRTLLFSALFVVGCHLAGCNHASAPSGEQQQSSSSRRAMTSDCAALPAGLIHWWPGENDARDVQGISHGTLRNGATFSEGKVGQAFLLDGVDDFIDLGNDTSLHFSRAEFTLALWLKFNSLGKDCGGYDDECTRGIWAKMLRVEGRGTGEDGWYLAKTNDNGFSFSLGGGLDKNGCVFWKPTTVSSTTIVNAGHWYHLAVVKNAGMLALYVNGAMEESKPLPVFTDTHATSMKLGAYAPEYDRGEEGAHLEGLLDEVQIYQRGLSEREIEALYEARSAGACNIIIDVKPGEAANFFACDSAEEIIAVAVLSMNTVRGESLNFDASTLALATARFGPEAARDIHGEGHLADVDDDGDLDALFHFRFGDTGIAEGDESVNFRAYTEAGRPLRGCDTIRTPAKAHKKA